MAELDLAISNPDKSSGVIETDWLPIETTQRLGDCGKAGDSSVLPNEAQFRVLVKPADPGTSVMQIYGQFRSSNGSGEPISCVSTGVLEERLHSAVMKKLG